MVRQGRAERERRFRQEHVMEVAEELFAAGGYEAMTMDDVARAAEMSKSTLYTVFSSKDELLCAMELRDARLGFKLLQAASAVGGSGAERMLAYGRAFYQFYREHPKKLLLRTFLDARKSRSSRVSDELSREAEQHNQAEVELLRGLVIEARNDGSIDPQLQVELVMSHFIYTLHPIAKQALFSTHCFASFAPDSYFESYLRLFMNGLRPAAKGPVS